MPTQGHRTQQGQFTRTRRPAPSGRCHMPRTRKLKCPLYSNPPPPHPWNVRIAFPDLRNSNQLSFRKTTAGVTVKVRKKKIILEKLKLNY